MSQTGYSLVLGLLVLGAVHFLAANILHGKNASVATLAKASLRADAKKPTAS